MRNWLHRHIEFTGSLTWWAWGFGIDITVILANVIFAVSLGPLYGTLTYIWKPTEDDDAVS